MQFVHVEMMTCSVDRTTRSTSAATTRAAVAAAATAAAAGPVQEA